MQTSTPVYKKKRPVVKAELARKNILAAARSAFSRSSYDATGIREIALAADVDPAVVIRRFGSKAELFRQAAAIAALDDPVFDGPLESLGARLANHLLEPDTSSDDPSFSRMFQLLLHSAPSQTAAPILAATLRDAILEPLTRRLPQHDAEMRAALIVAIVLGFATLRFALHLDPSGEAMDRQSILTDTIQRLVDTPI